MLESLKELMVHEISVRLARESDKERLLSWRNNPAVSKFARTKSIITNQDHIRWFEHRLNTINEEPIFIFNIDAVAIGMTRLDFICDEPKTFEVSILLDQLFQKTGHGKRILAYTCETAINDYLASVIQASIHKDNVISQKLFLNSGFAEVEDSAASFSFFKLRKGNN